MTDANFNPIYGFDVGSLPLGADVKLLSTLAVNKTRIGSLGSDRIGSDWYFAFAAEELFREKLFLIMTQVARNKKSEFSQQESNL